MEATDIATTDEGELEPSYQHELDAIANRIAAGTSTLVALIDCAAERLPEGELLNKPSYWDRLDSQQKLTIRRATIMARAGLDVQHVWRLKGQSAAQVLMAEQVHDLAVKGFGTSESWADSLVRTTHPLMVKRSPFASRRLRDVGQAVDDIRQQAEAAQVLQDKYASKTTRDLPEARIYQFSTGRTSSSAESKVPPNLWERRAATEGTATSPESSRALPLAPAPAAPKQPAPEPTSVVIDQPEPEPVVVTQPVLQQPDLSPNQLLNEQLANKEISVLQWYNGQLLNRPGVDLLMWSEKLEVEPKVLEVLLKNPAVIPSRLTRGRLARHFNVEPHVLMPAR